VTFERSGMSMPPSRSLLSLPGGANLTTGALGTPDGLRFCWRLDSSAAATALLNTLAVACRLDAFAHVGFEHVQYELIWKFAADDN
jgi:hypothetical protein